MSITRAPFGVTPAGETVDKYTLTNAHGASVSIITYGGTLQAICVPDKTGKLVDVCLGYETMSDYLRVPGYMGALIGRYGNRIAHSRFTLNGQEIVLNANEGANHLHGGLVGFNQKVWAAQPCEGDGQDSLALSIVSPDGEENYPGTLQVTVTYSFSDDGELTLHYEATCDKDTVCNLTNHAYFNLSGHNSGTVTGHMIQINADAFTVVDAACIPTGELRDVTGTPFDLRTPTKIADGLKNGADDEQLGFGHGYDHNFVIAREGEGISKAVELYSPATGIMMETFTDLPGVQFYGGNMLDPDFPGKDGRIYEKRDGLCLETQYYPDSPNQPTFPSCVLKAGEKYDTTTVYKFSVMEE